jgi:hypothetical protein
MRRAVAGLGERARASVDWRWVGSLVGRYGLPVWFLAFAIGPATTHLLAGRFAIDARLYTDAARLWLDGGDPWSAFVLDSTNHPFHFSGMPPTVLLSVPFTLLPAESASWTWFLISLVAAVVIVRHLRLPLYWLLFPPLVEGVLVANPHIATIALILAGSGWIAPLLKIYAVSPLVGERKWGTLAVSLALAAVSVAAWPSLWLDYLGDVSASSGRLLAEAAGGYSAFPTLPFLLVALVSLVALAPIAFRSAGWLAVPAAWPATQFFYSTYAMPVMTPWLAITLSIPLHLIPPAAIVVQVLAMLTGRGGRGTDLFRPLIRPAAEMQEPAQKAESIAKVHQRETDRDEWG